MVVGAMRSADPATSLLDSVQRLVNEGHDSGGIALFLDARSVHAGPLEVQAITEVIHRFVGDVGPIKQLIAEKLGLAMQDQSPALVLRSMLLEILSQTNNRAAVALALSRLRFEVEEAKENVLLDMLDLMTGWCSESARI
jgi:hypothetical protein